MKARVFSNSCLQGHYHKLIFLPPERLHILPGQFVMIRVSSSDTVTDPLLSRPFSIHRQAMDGSIEILYKVVGKGTDLLTHLRKGDYIEFIGPLGNSFPIPPRTQISPPVVKGGLGGVCSDEPVMSQGSQRGMKINPLNPPLNKGGDMTTRNPPLVVKGGIGGLSSDEVLIIAGGIGVAPMLSLIETIKSTNPETTIKVFLGGRGEEDLLCVEELKSLTSNIFLTTNDGSVGTKGYVTDALHDYLHIINGHEQRTQITVYACGPTPMLRKVLELTEEPPDSPPLFKGGQGGVKTYISLESAMACGIGLCMGCVVKKRDDGYLLVCKDGPVFDANEIVMSNEL